MDRINTPREFCLKTESYGGDGLYFPGCRGGPEHFFDAIRLYLCEIQEMKLPWVFPFS